MNIEHTKRKETVSVTSKLYVSLHSKDSKKRIKRRREKRHRDLMKLKRGELIRSLGFNFSESEKRSLIP